MTAVIAKRKPWTDPDFPPTQLSLYSAEMQDIDLESFNDLGWKRASEICSPTQLFKDEMDPSDVIQGQLSNCYFLATLCSLA